MEANKYIGLAKQLDTKRNALHFESTGKQGEFILGCSLRVERVGGREERVVCIAVHSSGSTQELIDGFYARVKEAIKKLENFNYRIIGLWEEGDLDALKQVLVPEDMLKYVFGKMLAGEKVAIKSGSPIAGISLIRQISAYIGSLPAVKLVLAVSQYPVDNVIVSISPMEPKPDFELDPANLTWKQAPDYKDYYMLLAETMVQFPMDVKAHPSMNLKDLAIYIKNKTFQEYKDHILEMFISTPSAVNKFFELHINQKETVEVFVRYWSNLTPQPLPVNDKLAGLIIRICSKKDSFFPSHLDFTNSESEHIRRIYANIRGQEGKKAVDIDLLKSGTFLSYAIKDTINRIYKENDIDLLNALFNVSLSDDYNKKAKFKKLIDDELYSHDYEDLLSLLKIIANNVDSLPGDGGKVFYESLITIIRNRGYYFSDNLNKRELKSLERIFGKGSFSKKQQAYSSEKGSLLKYVAIGVAVLLFVGSMAYFLIPGIFQSSGNPNTTNDSNNSTMNHISNSAPLKDMNNTVNDSNNSTMGHISDSALLKDMNNTANGSVNSTMNPISDSAPLNGTDKPITT